MGPQELRLQDCLTESAGSQRALAHLIVISREKAEMGQRVRVALALSVLFGLAAARV